MAGDIIGPIVLAIVGTLAVLCITDYIYTKSLKYSVRTVELEVYGVQYSTDVYFFPGQSSSTRCRLFFKINGETIPVAFKKAGRVPEPGDLLTVDVCEGRTRRIGDTRRVRNTYIKIV